jgi:hypothetical protein
MKITAYTLSQKGGKWLGVARSYLQCKAMWGDRLIWGSQDSVTLTVKQIEELASEVAAAAFNEMEDKDEVIASLRSKYMMLQIHSEHTDRLLSSCEKALAERDIKTIEGWKDDD